ncbi:hypothetical protein BN9982_530014 [Mycobacterium tuberculosis]|nr:hypothetical protein BN9982_530014 [Mycobacterium tuberculosis]
MQWRRASATDAPRNPGCLSDLGLGRRLAPSHRMNEMPQRAHRPICHGPSLRAGDAVIVLPIVSARGLRAGWLALNGKLVDRREHASPFCAPGTLSAR